MTIHGLLSSIDYFSFQAYLEGVDVRTPDRLGYETQRGSADPGGITLQGQARHVADYLRRHLRQPAWILGHSVGGAIAMLVASQAPDLVCGLISVEGNFTLNDAFWCRKIAPMDAHEWQVEYDRMCGDAEAWLRASGIESRPEREQWERIILANQPAATVQAMARAVVKETASEAYLASVKVVVDRGTPIHLIAGETSRASWDVPAWIAAAAQSDTMLPGVGHMMMLETPQAFCHAVRDILQGD